MQKKLAQTTQIHSTVVPFEKNNPQYYKLIITELLLLITTTRGSLAPRQMTALLFEMKKNGLLSPHLLSIFYFIQVERTSTRQRIVEELGLTESVVYKMVTQLVKQGFIKKAGKVAGPTLGGHKPDLYAVLDVTPTEIAEARVKEQQRQIPGYLLSCKITQFLLEEWIPSTSTPKEITLTTMKRIVGYHFEVN